MELDDADLETKEILNKLRLTKNLILLASFTLIVILVSFFTLNKQKGANIINKLITPPSAPTSTVSQIENIEGWKTFKNSKYKYEIKYPNNWTLSTEENSSNYLVFISPPNKESTNNSSGNVMIMHDNILFTAEGNSPQNQFKSFMESCNSQTPTSCTEKNKDDYRFEKEISIAGTTAFQTYGGCCMDIGRHVFLFADNLTYRFTLKNLSSQTDKIPNEEIFEQILSTFRFLE